MAPTLPTLGASLGPILAPAVLADLERSAESLRDAIRATDAATRYACAHVSALRAAAAVIAARPERVGKRRSLNAWVLLRRVAPELEEWATFFAGGAAKRAAAEAGASNAVTEREADDLVREADRFLAVVERSLGLLAHVPWEQQLAWRPSCSA